MYFDWCENPEELRKALGDLLRGTTFVRADLTGAGPHSIPMIGPTEDGILKQAFLEARNVAEKLCKRCPALPALPDTQCLPLEGISRMLAWCDEAAAMWIDPVPGITVSDSLGKAEDLTSKADKVHELVLKDSVRERFREQDRLFWDKLKAWWQANAAYEAALKPFDEKVYDCVRERQRCAARMARLHKQGLRTSAEYRQAEKAVKRCSEAKAKADEELERAEARLPSPGPCPTEWLQPPRYRDLPLIPREIMEYMFRDDPAMSDEAVRLRAYALLTILHDYALKGEVSLIAGADVWPRDDEDIPEDSALMVWESMEANPSWSCATIDRALRVVQADLDSAGLKPGAEEPPGTTINEQVRNQAQLTDTEENILEALGDEQMTGRVLLKEAGYDNSSHYRQILSHLVKRGILEKTGHGYRRARPACEPPPCSEDHHG